MIGLKRGAVALCNHAKEWEENAAETIKGLKEIFGDTACDIQHIVSTAIRSIKAKPIIDIAVGVKSFANLDGVLACLEESGIYICSHNRFSSDLLYVINDAENRRTHQIHILIFDSSQRGNYVNFRDYMNTFPKKAKEYENLKITLAEKCNHVQIVYTDGKHDYMKYTLRKALVWSYLGKNITVKIDRPIGSVHPKHSDLIHSINYGYIEGVFGGDGEELDVYVLGIDKAVEVFFGKVIAIVHRENDAEDKLVAAPNGMKFTSEQISEAEQLQEQYYKSRIEVCEND